MFIVDKEKKLHYFQETDILHQQESKEREEINSIKCKKREGLPAKPEA